MNILDIAKSWSYNIDERRRHADQILCRDDCDDSLNQSPIRRKIREDWALDMCQIQRWASPLLPHVIISFLLSHDWGRWRVHWQLDSIATILYPGLNANNRKWIRSLVILHEVMRLVKIKETNFTYPRVQESNFCWTKGRQTFLFHFRVSTG